MRNIRVKMFDGIVGMLCDVRHVLDLRKNLITLGTLDDNGFSYKTANGVEGEQRCLDNDERAKASREYLQIDGYHNCRWSCNHRARVRQYNLVAYAIRAYG